MSDPTSEIVVRQRRRLVAAILGHAEREFYAQLTQAQRDSFREKVLQAAAAYADVTLDLVRTQTQGVWVNEDVLEILAEINEQFLNRP